MFSMLHLLEKDPTLPADARWALSAARNAKTPFAAEQLRIKAARVLVGAFDLSWLEVSELLGLWEGPRAVAAA
jgi:hypothetical protein